MTTPSRTPDLAQIAAGQLAACLGAVVVGSPLPIDSSSDICSTLELLVPQLLRPTHPEWGIESIDGFFFSRAIKRDEACAELAGTCILISDQTVTPFAFDLCVADDGTLRPARIRLGEPGAGQLGISGPECNSRAAAELLSGLNSRLDRVDWAYDLAAP